MIVLRTLDVLEKYYYWRTQLKYYSNCRIVAEYNVVLSEETVFTALEQMLRSFPQLCTKISSNGFKAQLNENICFGDVVEFIEDDRLNDSEVLLNKFHNNAFNLNEDSVLWRLKIVNKKVVVFYYDHILYDGGSGKNFHEEFAKALATPDGKSILKYKDMNSLVFQLSYLDSLKYSIMPSPFQVINYSPRWCTLIYAIFQDLAPQFVTKFIRFWFEKQPYANLLTYRNFSFDSSGLKCNTGNNRCKIINIPSSELKLLLKLCKDHNVKLTSLIVIIGQMSMGAVLKTTDDLKTSVPVDIRKFIDLDKGKEISPMFSDVFGIYMSAVEIELPALSKFCPNDQVDWDLVDYVHGKIHQQIPYSPELVGLLKYVDPKKFIIDKIKKQNKSNLEVSNLGVISNKQYPQILNAWFDQPPEMFSVNVISSNAGANLVLRTSDDSVLDSFHSGFLRVINILLSSLK